MNLMDRKKKMFYFLSFLAVLGLLFGCSEAGDESETAVSDSTNLEGETLTLPRLTAVNLEGRPLQVVASTSLIGDVVAQVGEGAIDLTTLMGTGQDPHSYEPGAQELTAVAKADIIFINGWGLEEALVQVLETISGDVPVVPISANIEPLLLNDEDSDHEPGGADPHVWLDIQNVRQWTENAVQVLTALDPANATTYRSNADTYLAKLDILEKDVKDQLATIPTENRVLVTNHDSFGYFAKAYGFEILGTVLPGSSTFAEPSARDLRNLIETMETHGVCTIFTETAVNDNLAQTIASELANCDTVQAIPLYTGAIGPTGRGADNYIGMFQANVAAIVAGLN